MFNKYDLAVEGWHGHRKIIKLCGTDMMLWDFRKALVRAGDLREGFMEEVALKPVFGR